MKKYVSLIFLGVLAFFVLFNAGFKLSSEEDGDKKGAFKYKDFQTPEYCQGCHNQFYQQWSQAMMSQAYTHHW
ncbi:MAG: hypothetical protein ACOCVA_07090, partial [Prolixibacteraceae bacterium]